MLFYTQLIFVKEGKEAVFHAFEDYVLPLLGRYNGKLLYRLRPGNGDVVTTSIDYPYEVHLISFGSKADFEAYARDEDRTKYLAMKNESVEKVVLIEGVQL